MEKVETHNNDRKTPGPEATLEQFLVMVGGRIPRPLFFDGLRLKEKALVRGLFRLVAQKGVEPKNNRF